MTLEKLYTVAEACEYLGYKERTVRSWIKAGKLHARRISKTEFRITESDIKQFLEDCKI